MKKVIAIIEQNRAGFYSVYTNENFPFGFFGEGNTAQEAMDDFKAVYAAMKKEDYEQEHHTALENVEFVFKYDVNSFLSAYHNVLTLSGLQRLTGISQQQLSQYLNGTRHASPKTAARMQQSIQSFANQLRNVEFV